VTGVVSRRRFTSPIGNHTTSILSVFALSLEKFLPMSASSLFCVNGVSTTALLDASLEKTMIRREFAARCDLSDGDTAVVSAPIGDKTVSSPVVVNLADHVHDVAVGADWLRSVTQERVCFHRCTVLSLKPQRRIRIILIKVRLQSSGRLYQCRSTRLTMFIFLTTALAC
jgi:hypothetical protein